MPIDNRYHEAFKEKANLVGVTTIAALSMVMLNPLPLLVGLVAEVAYLMTVPDSGWYGRILRLREAAALQKRRGDMRSQVMPALCPELRERYKRLELMRQQIASQFQDDQHLFSEAPQKFDYLLDKFLVFASKQTQFTQYLNSVHDEVCGTTPPPPPAPSKKRDIFAVSDRQVSPTRSASRMMGPSAAPPPPPVNTPPPPNPADPRVQQMIEEIQQKYTQQQNELTTLLASEQDDNTKAVLEKRMEILKRRAEFLTKIAKALTNLSHQLQLLEDTLGLINDEIRARSPEQVLEDIDDVISQTDSMTQVLEELAPYEQMVSRMDQTSARS